MALWRRLLPVLLGLLVLSLGPSIGQPGVHAEARAKPASATAPQIGLTGNPVVNLAVPYVHQVWDTADTFDGNWACGATSAVMALAYYRKLTPRPITISQPTTHSNDYGFYVSSVYTAFGYTFNRLQNDASGRPAYGGYGHTTISGSAWAYLIYDYVRRHDLQYEYKAGNQVTFDNIKAALDQGHPVILSTRLTSAGHIILVRGYTDDRKLIVNDPYGNRYGPNGYGRQRDGENVQYSWDEARVGSYMIVVKGAVDSDDNRTLSVGQTLNGTIAPSADDDPYSFTTTAGTSLRLTMQRNDTSLDSYLELYGPSGLVAVNDDVDGTLDSRIEFRAPADGTYRIIARSYNRASSGSYRIALSGGPSDGDDGRWLSMGGSLQGTISPNNDRDTYYINGTSSAYISLRMNRSGGSLDSFLELYGPDGTLVASNDDGGGNLNSWIVYRFGTTGTYRLVARSYASSSGGGYTVSAESVRGDNYALNRPTYISSLQDSSYRASYATDGSRSTRWSSGSNLSQFIYVDLGQERDINQVVVRWETAHATGYGIYYYSAANSRWQVAYTTNTGDGDVDAINTSFRSRYIYLAMWNRNSRWSNYSLWELEAYNTAAVLAPLVPPEDPDKPVEEGYTPLAPLAPNPEGKDLPILTLPSDQETQPLAEAENAAAAPSLGLDDTFGPPVTGLSLSQSTVARGFSATASAVDPHDTDSRQTGSGIAAYRWAIVPAVPGETGAVAIEVSGEANVTLPTNELAPGDYRVVLAVQDDEGNWSDEMTAPLVVVDYRVYLPLVD